jgi:hypothetical protein
MAENEQAKLQPELEQQPIPQSERGESELSEEQLDQVAGGFQTNVQPV